MRRFRCAFHEQFGRCGPALQAAFDGPPLRASGVARDGEAYSNTYAWFWEMREGKVARAQAFFDSIAFNDLWRRVRPADTGKD